MPVSASPAPLLGDRLCENGFECVKILPATNDAHGGVIVDLKEPLHSEVFATLLRSSLLHWKQQGKDGVWIKFPIELVNLVETAVKEGFWYHHAEPNYLMLVYWIPKTDCTIPPNASHCVAVGAIVLNDNKEVLVVLEKKGGFHGIGVWKIPTGVVDAGEEIFEAAIREVKEETGWMPFEEFADQPFNQMHEPFKYMIELCLAKVEKVYNGFSPRPISSYFVEELNYLYLNSHCLDKSS
ncbi:hypothetical protein JHK85_023774 [Glycine max]|nr:hypothetical protein JHK85_023774 [Glycine max]